MKFVLLIYIFLFIQHVGYSRPQMTRTQFIQSKISQMQIEKFKTECRNEFKYQKFPINCFKLIHSKALSVDKKLILSQKTNQLCHYISSENRKLAVQLFKNYYYSQYISVKCKKKLQLAKQVFLYKIDGLH